MAQLSALLEDLVSTTETSLFGPGPDVLADYSPNVVVGWYERLALSTQDWYTKSRPGGSSLSAEFLLYWQDSSRSSLDNGGRIVWNTRDPKAFEAAIVADNKSLREKLRSEVRPVILSQRQRGHDANKGYGGAVRKLRDGWDGTPLTLPYLAGSVEGVTNAVKTKLIWQLIRHVAPQDIDWVNLDIYASLHTFAVESTVVIRATPVSGDPTRFTIDFDSWNWRVIDRYDWDDQKYNDMPNPDFNKPAGTFVVRPDLNYLTVWHRNATRVEAAGLAAPFPVESTLYAETDPELLKSAVVQIDQ